MPVHLGKAVVPVLLLNDDLGVCRLSVVAIDNPIQGAKKSVRLCGHGRSGRNVLFLLMMLSVRRAAILPKSVHRVRHGTTVEIMLVVVMTPMVLRLPVMMLMMLLLRCGMGHRIRIRHVESMDTVSVKQRSGDGFRRSCVPRVVDLWATRQS